MTLKRYLEKQIRYWTKVKTEAVIDSSTYGRADGRIMAYIDILLECPDDVLNKKINEER